METRTYNTIVTSKELEVLNNDNKQNFYTSNGWQGSKYDIKVKELVEATKLSESVSNSDNHKKKRGKSLQDIIDQTRRLNGHAGRNWYWNFKREKLINKIYTIYVANIQKLGAFSEPEKKFTREEYAGITPTESLGEVVYDQCGDRQLIIGCYPTKEETEKEAKALNGFTDDNGRLKELSKKVI